MISYDYEARRTNGEIVRGGMDAASVADLTDALSRQGLFLENMYTGRDTPLQEGYVDGEWKYIRYSKTPHPYKVSDIERLDGEPVFEMLFNLKNDPGEMNNRIHDPTLKAKLAELRDLCEADLSQLLKLRQEYSTHYQLAD